MSAAMVDMMFMILMLGGGYYLYSTGKLDELFSKDGGGGGGGRGGGGSGGGSGGGAARGGSTGNCSGGPYKGIGKTVSTSTRGPTTRHYASGKADTTTIEKNAKGISFKNYQFVSYITLNKVGSDDNVSVKIGGRHMNGGWYDHGVSFKGGQTCLGTEKKHPSTQSCIVKGKKIGSIVGKKIGVAGVMLNGKTEIWTDSGGGWQLGASGMNPGGFKQLSGDNECQLRIDDAPGVQIHCSVVQEIGGGGGTAPTKQSNISQIYYGSQAEVAEPGECGEIIEPRQASVAINEKNLIPVDFYSEYDYE